MPIKIPDALPATDVLESENIFVMTEFRAMHQDIRPLKLALLNLMPTKIATETQMLRKLANTPLQIEITLLQTASHIPTHVSSDHLKSFYRTFEEIKDDHFDGMIITGAPVETLDFEEVDYWDELCQIMDWTSTNVHSTLHICWGAQAGIYHHYGIQKYELPHKMFGVFEHRLLKHTSPWVRGFDDRFWAPHSRFTEVRAADIDAHAALELISISEEAGVYLAKSTDSRRFFVFGHPEYDRLTLKGEYERDLSRGLDTALPCNYFPHDDPAREPLSTWRAHAQLLYTNWLNYYVYQTTPYDVTHAGSMDEADYAALGSCAEIDTYSEDLEDTTGAVARAGAPLGRLIEAAPKSWSGNEKNSAFIRAETEDDDGYDPYSDRRDEPPFFEPDPWK